MECENDDTHVKNGMEKEILKQFKSRISDVLLPYDTDAILFKWLRAKNFNLRKCETLYREYISTRTVYKLDEIEHTWDVPEVIEKYEFANHLGFAKDGTPIHYMAFGRGDFHGFIMSMDIYDLSKYCTVVLERSLRMCREQSKKLGKEINEVTYIVDMEGFVIRRALTTSVLEIGFDFFRLFQDHYPEIWNHVLIVNAASYFYTVFNLFRPIFRHTLIKNVRVVSRAQTAELLLKYVDADILPAFLGGKRVDSNGDPMCSEFMKLGGQIPEQYFLRNRSPLLPTDIGVETIQIPPRGVYNSSFLVTEPNSVIRMEMRSEGGSIYGVMLYRSFGEDPENPDFPAKDEYLDEHNENCNVRLISPNVRWPAHLSPTNNFCYAPWPGIYIFKFDNSYSWLTGRRLYWRVTVIPPNV